MPDNYTKQHLLEWCRTQAPIDPDVEPERYAEIITTYLNEYDEWERAQFEGWSFIFRACELEGLFDFD